MPAPSVVAVLRDRLDDLPILDESDQASLVSWLQHSGSDSEELLNSELPRLSPDVVGPRYNLAANQSQDEKRETFCIPESQDYVDCLGVPLNNVDTRLPPYKPFEMPTNKVQRIIRNRP